ncbi:unnamed protein product [Allacma fusca]|uniref:Uncharacterized protein n=1 Tax=Allacma fusca TaxID=39272 RepID=A0A8J2L738_9HEXA|nr:unnamed protein product [Allacma fusca]
MSAYNPEGNQMSVSIKNLATDTTTFAGERKIKFPDRKYTCFQHTIASRWV